MSGLRRSVESSQDQWLATDGTKPKIHHRPNSHIAAKPFLLGMDESAAAPLLKTFAIDGQTNLNNHFAWIFVCAGPAATNRDQALITKTWIVRVPANAIAVVERPGSAANDLRQRGG